MGKIDTRHVLRHYPTGTIEGPLLLCIYILHTIRGQMKPHRLERRPLETVADFLVTTGNVQNTTLSDVRQGK